MAQVVKNPPTRQETQAQSLGKEEPLEREMATHSSIFAWKISCTEEPGGLYSPWDHKRVSYNLATEHKCHHANYILSIQKPLVRSVDILGFGKHTFRVFPSQ